MNRTSKHLFLGLGVIVLSVFSLSTAVSAATVSINPPTEGTANAATELTVTSNFHDPAVNAPYSTQWTIVITNTGASTAYGVSVTTTLPVEFRFVTPAEASALASLGDLAPGETIIKTLAVSIPASTPSNRYVNETLVSATNVPTQESDAAITVNGARVLGASDTNLAETGFPATLFYVIGSLLMLSGLSIAMYQRTNAA